MDTELKLEAVMPTGSPSPSQAVTMVTPVAKVERRDARAGVLGLAALLLVQEEVDAILDVLVRDVTETNILGSGGCVFKNEFRCSK